MRRPSRLALVGRSKDLESDQDEYLFLLDGAVGSVGVAGVLGLHDLRTCALAP
uniref:Uncharacterized protein n=1 Tax=Arundo donax TaxID=35708 RepID=A0A0A8ZMN7_ARUDO